MEYNTHDVGEAVMHRIRKHDIRMRPRLFFLVGSALSFVGIVLSLLVAIFSVSLLSFAVQSDSKSMNALLSHFSWWGPLMALVSTFAGLYLVRRYDFSYRVPFKVLVGVVCVAILTAGIVLEKTGLLEILLMS